MAGNYGAEGGYVYQDDWRAEVSVTVVDTNATTCTVYVTGKWRSIYGVSSYCTGSVTKDASGNMQTGIGLNITAGGSASFATKSFTVARGEKQKTITCKAVVVGGGSTYSGVSSTASVNVPIPAIAYQAPEEPTDCTAVRDSDAKATVSWTNGETSTVKPRTAILIERMTDGGNWTQIQAAAADATSYADNSISANHRYAYRVRSQGNGGYSEYATAEGYVYTTPAAPSAVTLSKTAQTTIQLGIEGAAPYATGYKVELTYDGGTTWQTVEESTSLPITVNVSGGTVRFRVASLNGSLQSAWTLSESIVTICPPLAPTITASPSNPTAMGDQCTVAWLPNHPDGTAQTAAQVKLTGPGGTSTTVDLTTETAYTFTPEATGTYSIQVRTKGLDPEWGAWSDSASWGVYDSPTVIITSPATDGAEIVALPLEVAWTVTDPTGVSAQRVIISDAGGEIFNRQVNGSTFALSLTDSDVALQNEAAYTITVRAMGGSGLITAVQRTFAVSWLPPVAPTLELSEGEGASTQISIGSQTFDAAGEVLELPRSGIMTSLHIDGKSVQDGTPSPSAPIPIKSVESRNLLGNLVAGDYSAMGITCIVGEDNTITFGGTSTSSGNIIIPLEDTVAFPTGDAYWHLRNDVSSGNMSITLQPALAAFNGPNIIVAPVNKIVQLTNTQGIKTIGSIRFYIVNGTTYAPVTLQPSIEYSSEATAYQPYGSISIVGAETVPIDLQGNALRSLPDGTRDALDVVDGNKTLTKRVGAVDMSTLGFAKSSDGEHTASVNLMAKLGYPSGKIDGLMVEQYHKGKSDAASKATDGNMFRAGNWLVITNLACSTTAEFTEALSGVMLYYPLATPQTISLGRIDLPYCTDTAYVDAMVQPTISASFRFADSADTPETESVTVQRINPDGSTWTVASNLPLGGTCIDPLPPLGVEATYLATASAQSGATASETYGITIGGREWVLNFGNAAQEYTEFIGNPDAAYSLRKGGASYHFARGAEIDGTSMRDGLPVRYDTHEIDEDGSLSFDDELNALGDSIRALCRRYGTGWARDPFGHRWRAHFDVDIRHGVGYAWNTGLSWSAVEFREAW